MLLEVRPAAEMTVVFTYPIKDIEAERNDESHSGEWMDSTDSLEAVLTSVSDTCKVVELRGRPQCF
jgi:hypothetical protein